MTKRINHIILVVITLFVLPVIAQETKEEVRETVTVVKSYNPEIEPSKKQALIPKKTNFEKKTTANLKYRIGTFPVLDSHIPKFEAPYLHWISPMEDVYSSLFKLTAGTNSSLNVNLSHHEYVSSRFNVGFRASYDTTKGGIEGYVYSPLNKNRYVGSTMGFSTKKGDGSLNASYQKQEFNYYGKQIWIGSPTSTKSTNQYYNRAAIDFKYHFNSGAIKNLSLNFNTISDLTKSDELDFKFESETEFKLADRLFRIDAFVDYLSGGFENAALSLMDNSKPDPYKYTQLGLQPQLDFSKDKLELFVGIDLNYLSQNSSEEVGVSIYPLIDAQYQLSNEVILKGGLNGYTQLNSFSNLTKQNPYLSPTLEMKPSYTLIDIDFGLEANSGKFLSLDLNTSASRVKNHPLIKLNHQNYFRNDEGPYLSETLNSFEVVYDQIDEVNISGSLLVRPAEYLSLKTGISYSKYRTLNEEVAWNLPNLKAYGSINAKLAKGWMLSSQLNFIGARKDREITVVQFIMPGEYPGVTYDLEAFVNLNASLHYQYSENWSFELKAENLTNNQYQMWYNYPDLGATITLGAQYRFDL